MKTINCVVRLEEYDCPIMFWYEVYPRGSSNHLMLGCFTNEDGHNGACLEYMRSLKPCPSDIAEQFVSRYNHNYTDGNTIMKLCKRLVKPKI